MGCEDCREAISAGLDGEELLGEGAAVEVHLVACAECRRFAERAARVTRLTRTRVVEPVPDLVAAVAAAAVAAGPRPPRRSSAGVVRMVLGMVGLAQFALAVAGLVGIEAGPDTGVHHGVVALAGASAAHLANESSAWNVALAVGFLWAALGSSRVAGLLPVIAAFVGVLAVLSVLDAVAGRVEADRLLGHGLVVLGFILLLMLQRRPGEGGGARLLDAPSGPPVVDRSISIMRRRRDDGGGLQPTARHRVA